jgi:hypothetical protein
MTIARISGFATHGTIGECESQLADIVAQLKRKHLGIKEQVTPIQDGTSYMLSYERAGCSYLVSVGGRDLTVHCASHYRVFCKNINGGAALNLEAGDTGISEQAREEAKELSSKAPNMLE